MLVPPDPQRQFVSKSQYKQVHAEGRQPDDHGFSFVDPIENAASRGAAGYYAWSPAPGFRFIAIDTVSEAGVIGPSADGNIDDPQFRWLERQLQSASDRNELIVLFGHHPVRSLRADLPDELAPPCTSLDDHGHDHNPGCDLDARLSSPIHLGEDLVPGDPRESLVELVRRFPHVMAFVAGHTHENKITPFTRTDGTAFWAIETAAEADWPQQNRLLEVMDNRDGTLSILSTVLDHVAIAESAPSGAPASGMTARELASVSRALSLNDPHAGEGTGAGAAADRNVELLLRDPRR
jgi:3',5'-cyclic AMP phosphodiesterase CpdA